MCIQLFILILFEKWPSIGLLDSHLAKSLVQTHSSALFHNSTIFTFSYKEYTVMQLIMITSHFPDNVVCPFLLPPLVLSHFCIFPTLFPDQPCGSSIALFPSGEHSDAVKSTLCCRQLSSLMYRWFCSVPQELCCVLPIRFNVIETMITLTGNTG